MKPHRPLVAVALSVTFLTFGVGCQTADHSPEPTGRAEMFLKRKPEIFSLLENNERMEQSSVPPTT